jgi:hypothetical protein
MSSQSYILLSLIFFFHPILFTYMHIIKLFLFFLPQELISNYVIYLCKFKPHVTKSSAKSLFNYFNCFVDLREISKLMTNHMQHFIQFLFSTWLFSMDFHKCYHIEYIYKYLRNDLLDFILLILLIHTHIFLQVYMMK